MYRVWGMHIVGYASEGTYLATALDALLLAMRHQYGMPLLSVLVDLVDDLATAGGKCLLGTVRRRALHGLIVQHIRVTGLVLATLAM